MFRSLVGIVFAASVVGVMGCAVATKDDDSSESASTEQGVKTRICPTIYKPVCGKDGRTYSNTCAAGGAQHVAYDGECTDACAAVLCITGTECKTFGKTHVRCVGTTDSKTDPCNTVRCMAGSHCESVAIVCITTPCDPVAECVADPCTSTECGPAPMLPTTLCSDGSTAGPGDCTRNASGTCGWSITTCP